VLNVVNTEDAAVAVTLTSSTGVADEFTIEPNTTLRVPVSNGTTYTVEPSGRVSMSVTQAADGFISSYAIDPQTPGSSPLRVFP